MRRRILCAALVLVLLASSLLAVFGFEDSDQHWAKAYIDRAVSLGLFKGVTETEFRPDAPMTRAMFVTVLGRLAGVDPDEWQCDYLSLLFDDVDADAYYAPYLAWAVHTGVTGGTGTRTFSPDSNVTREQMARFISNYLACSGATLQSLRPALPENIPGTGTEPVGEETEPVGDETAEDGDVPDEGGIPDGEPEPEPEEPDPATGGNDIVLPVLRTEEAPAEEEAPAQAAPESGLQRFGVSLDGRNGSLIRAPRATQTEDACDQFSDAAQIAPWARQSVSLLAENYLLTGMPDGEGGLCFAPQKNATRAECAALFCRLLDSLTPPEEPLPEPIALALNEQSVLLEAGQTRALVATVFPTEDANAHVLWYSTNPEVVSVDADGVLTAVGEGVEYVFAVSANRLTAMCEVTVTAPPEPEIPAGLGRADMTNDEKDMLVFGRLVDDPRTVYEPYTESGKQAALADMVWIVITTWDINSAGEKYTRTWSLQVHKNIAPTVQAIFAEIYALPEQVPIHSIGGFRWDGRCEHSCGTAIDINPRENPYVDKNGNILVGHHFDPENDPYSFPVGGAVDQIFAKYGFTRGIYWNSGAKDYMHYSFYGT